MKILMIAPTPFMADRGCHTQILLEVKALQDQGHEVLLCTYGLGREVPGVSTVRCWNPPWYGKLSAGPSYTKILLLPVLLLKSLQTIKRFRPDIVHAHLHEGAVIARVCQWFFGRPLYVFDMQGSLVGECLQHGFIRKGSVAFRALSWLERRIANWFPTVTQSETMLKELRELGAPDRRIENVKDAVDTDLFSPRPIDGPLAKKLGVDPARPCVLYMGLLEEYQGTDLMIQAFAKVVREIPDTQFLVIGFPHIEKYRAQAAALGVATSIVFLGRLEYSSLPPYLSLARIAVAPKIGLTEGDGKIYNYMAMGMAVVAFDRPVAREILADTGRFAAFGDAGDLAKQIVSLIRQPDEAKSLGHLARQRAERELSFAAVGNRLLNFYDKQKGQRAA